MPFPSRLPARLVAAACLAAAATAAHAQLESLNPTPVIPGKDVAWVPTPDAAVERMLGMAQVGPRDLVYDLGSGDGKIAIMAAKRFGARAVGVEFDPDLVAQSRTAARREGVADRVRFDNADIFAYDFRDATVVTLYLLTALNVKLRPKILEMKPGTRVASHMFRMGDWEPDEYARLGASDLFVWVVPARVAGAWVVTRGAGSPFEIVLEQRYQQVSGSARIAGESVPLKEVALRGDELRFALTGASGARLAFVGRVAGDRIAGEGGQEPWSAVRLRAR